MKVLRLLPLAALCALVITDTSFAQSRDRGFRNPPPDGPRLLHQRVERALSLDQLDVDGDGRVSEAEFIDGRLDRASEMFDRLDDDGDGLVSLEGRNFGIGFVEGGRAARGRAPSREEMQACLQESGFEPGHRLEFSDADEDGDKHLSINEFNAALQAQARSAFADLDADGDGYIDQDELKARREAAREVRGELRNCIRSSRN